MKKLVAALIVCMSSTLLGQARPEYKVTPQEAQQLMGDYLMAVVPTKPENSYFSPFMKERIALLQQETNEGALDLILDIHSFDPGKDPLYLMSTTWVRGKPTISINVGRLWWLIKVQGKMTGKPELYKNTFALALVHESVHLEKGHGAANADSLLQEEMRAWRKTDIEAVRPLRRSGHPLEPEVVAVDDILLKCHDSQNCKALKRFLLSGGKVGIQSKGRP